MVAQVKRHPNEDDEVFVSRLNLLSGGAAANTAYACAKLGLNTAFIGKLGLNDAFCKKIIDDFNDIGVNTTLIKYSNEYGTGSAYVALNEKGDRRIYAHSGAANFLSKQDIIEEELASTQTFFLSSLKNLEPFIEAAKIGKKYEIPVILNPGMLIIEQGLKNIKPLLEKIDILILSQSEFQTLIEQNIDDWNQKSIKDQTDFLLDLGIKIVIITTGKRGAVILTPHNYRSIPPIEVSQVVDTTGAGDAFSAGFIYGFIQNLSYNFGDLTNNVRIGNYVAGNCIQQLGARNGIPELK